LQFGGAKGDAARSDLGALDFRAADFGCRPDRSEMLWRQPWLLPAAAKVFNGERATCYER
jgi:hypothetical protein